MACESCQGRVLVVEDDPDIREVLRDLIGGLGCRVVLAADGVDALAQLERAGAASPCVIIADLNMPRLGGVGLVRRVRTGRHVGTPIVTMSAEPLRERPAHVELHLDKPFDFGALAATIGRLCPGGPARGGGARRD
ncbi:MAG: response regulator [Anaeromyxobacteraceae bacterium]